MNEEQKSVVPAAKPASEAVKNPKITYGDFAKVEIKAGKIMSAEKIPDTDKLLKLSVDFSETAPRQIVSGIAAFFPDPAALIGRTAMFVTNLEPRNIRGYESDGMLFAVSTPAGADGTAGVFSLLEPGLGIPPGTRAQ